MSATVEQRVAEMRFDNAQFERNVATSMSTIEGLNKSLNLLGASKGLDSLEKAAKKCDVSPLGNAVESVKLKFSAMEVIALTALQNITNSAINTGKRLIASLSTDQIEAGWIKFGQKTSSVGTLISQGYDLDTVTGQLERLNWFTDETSYNFTDMVDNIAKFTASGKDLTESVTAIEGVANWAALSGQNAMVASRAMYQISQAMGSGVMRKEDYKSIQNASMDTDEFRQKALDAAVALGTLQKNADGTYQSLMADTEAFTKSQFADHLTQDAWFTSDVMMKVFNDYSAAVDQIYEYAEEKGITASEAIEELGSKLDPFALKAFKAAQEARTLGDAIDSVKDAVSTGWMNTFELIFGNYEEAKSLWTDLANEMYDIFAEGGNVRNEILEVWKDAGGRDALVESFWNLWAAITQPIEAIKKAYREIFTGDTEKERVLFGERLAEITEKLRLLTARFLEFGKNGERISLAASKIGRVFKGLFAVVDLVGQALIAIGKFVSPVFSKIGKLSGRVIDAAANIGDWLVGLHDAARESDVFNRAIEKVLGIVRSFYKAFESTIYTPGMEIINAVLDVASKRMEQLKEAFKSFGSSAMETIKNLWRDLLSSGALDKLKEIFKRFGSGVKAVFAVIGEGLAAFITSIGSADFSGFFDIINSLVSGGIGVAIIGFIKSIRSAVSSGSGTLTSIKEVLGGALGCLEAYQESLKANTLMKIAAAVGILAVSLVALSHVDSAKLASALASVSILFGELLGAIAIIGAIDGLKSMRGVAGPMIKMAAAVLILAMALKTVSGIETDKLLGSITSILALVAMLVGSTMLLNGLEGKAIKGAGSMVIFAAAIAILASVCKSLSTMGWEEMAVGLAGIGIMLVLVTGFLHALPKDLGGGRVLATAFGMVLLASAMAILSGVCKVLSTMSWEEIGKGLAGIGGMLLEFAGFTWLLGSGGKMLAAGTSLFGVSIAILTLTAALSAMGKMSWAQIGKGLLTMGGSLVILALGINAMNGAVVGALAMLIVADALAILTPALLSFGLMSWESIAKGLIAIASAFAIIGVAGLLLGPISLEILALAGSVALIGVAAMTTGVGITLLATGLAALVALAPTIVSALGILLLGIIELIPQVVVALVDGLVIVCDAILDGLSRLLQKVSAFFASTDTNALVDGLMAVGLAVAAAVTGIAGKQIVKAAGTIIAIAGAILVLVLAIKVLETISLDGLGIAAGVVAGLMALFAGVLYVSQYATASKGAVIAIAVAVGLLAAALVGLSLIAANDPSAVLIALGALAGVMAMLAVVMVASSMVPTGAMGSIFAIAAVVAVLAAALYALASLPDTGAVLAVAASLSVAMLALAGTLAICTVVGAAAGPAAIGAGLLLLFIAAIVGVIAALGALSGGDFSAIDNGLELLRRIGAGIGEAIAAFAEGAMSSLPQIGEYIASFASSISEAASPEACKGIKDLSLALMTFLEAGIFNSISSLFGLEIPDLGGEFGKLGKGLREFNDQVVDIDGANVDIAAQALDKLADFADRTRTGIFEGKIDLKDFSAGLKDLGEALASFNASTGNITPSRITALASAIETLGDFAKNVSGFTWSDMETSMTEFGNGLSALTPGFSELLIALEDITIDADKVQAFTDAVETLSAAAKTISGVKMSNTNLDMRGFGEQLADFGKNFSKFGNRLTGIDTEKITAAGDAASALGDFAKTVSEIETGDSIKNLDSFGDELDAFGKDLADFYDDIGDIDATKLSASAEAVKLLGEFGQAVAEMSFDTSQGGVTISGFGAQLKAFGSHLAEYWEEIKDVSNFTGINESATAAKTLAEFGQTVAEIAYTDDNAMEKLGAQLTDFAKRIMGKGNFYELIKELEPDVLSSAASAMEELAEVARTVSKIDFEEGDGDLETFGSKLMTFGPKFKRFADGVAGINIDAARDAAEVAAALGDLTDGIGDLTGISTTKMAELIPFVSGGENSLVTMIETLSGIDTDGVTSFAKALKSLAEDGIEAFLDAFSGSPESAFEVGGDLTNAIAEGAEEGLDDVKTGFAVIADVAVAAVREAYQAFYDAGVYLVEGLVAAINDNAHLAQKAGAALGDSASGGLEGSLDINSPSKVAQQDGVYFATGFINMLWAWCKKSRSAGEGVGEAAMNGLNQSIATIAGVIDGSLDTQPTIRPVLDLSEIQNGIGKMNGMMAGSNGWVIAGAADYAWRTQRSVSRAYAGQNGASVDAKAAAGQGQGAVFYNTFNISGSNAEDIANRTMRKMQHQYERRNATWGS